MRARAPLGRGRDPLDLQIDPTKAPPGLWRIALISALGLFCLRLAVESLPPELDEPLVWRWLRALAEHPVRGSLALALLLRALLAGREAA